MSVFTRSSRISPATPEPLAIQRSGILWLWLVCAVLLLAYASPWLAGPGTALSFGAYDLGEWASLPPEVRTQNPPLVTSFLLRFPLAALTLVIGFGTRERRFTPRWLMSGLAVVLLVAAQLPPLEYFMTTRNDPNYSQQATLALVALVGAAMGLLTAPNAWRSLLAALFAALGAVTSAAGLLSAQALLAAYQMDTGVLLAAYLTIALFVAAAIGCAVVFVRAMGMPRT